MDGHTRIATWNLWGTYGPWRERQLGITTALAAAEPDVVGLQEVWHDGDVAQAEILADQLGLDHVLELRPPGEPGDGLAVLSRWPASARFDMELPRLGRPDCGCWALGCEIDHPTGSFRLVVTHLAWRLDDGAVRYAQLNSIVSRLQGVDPTPGPTVLVGDLNAPPDTAEIQMVTGKAWLGGRRPVFRDAWEVAGDGTGHTWTPVNHHVATERDPASRIDYVLVEWRSDEPGRVRSADLIGTEPVDGLYPSDHFGVVAELLTGPLA